MTKKLKGRLLIIAGTIFTGIGIIGILVPVLPTTPFLLLAAACYVRSSRRLYNWLLNNRLFGTYLKNYLEGKGMPLRIKLMTILLLWTAIMCSILFAVQELIIRLILLIVAVGVTIHITLLETIKEEKYQEESRNE